MTDLPTPGWFPDPLGRFEERYWDGREWTSQVRTQGQHSVDIPMGEPQPTTMLGTSGAGTAAVTATAQPTAQSTAPPKVELERRLKRERPPARLGEALSAVSGFLGIAGLAAILDDASGKGVGIGVGLLLIGLAYALSMVAPTFARPAGLVCAVIGAPLLVVAIFDGVLEGRVALILPALVVGAVWLAMFYGPGLRGAPVLVGGVLIAFWLAVLGLVIDNPSDNPYIGDDSSGTGGFDTFDPFDAIVGTAQDAGSLTLVCALILVLAAAVMDAKGWRVLATPFIAVAIGLTVVGLGLSLVGIDAGAVDAVLVAAAGSIIGVVGGLGQRRGSTWLGAVLFVSGVGSLVADLVDDTVGAGVLLLVLAAALLLAARPVEAALGRRTHSDPDPAARLS